MFDSFRVCLAESPELTPGIEDPHVAAREMEIPGAGRADIVIVQADGSVTVVECKLRSNSEIRMAVVGQILAYAAGLLGLSYHGFSDRFERASGLRLATFFDGGAADFDAFQRAVEDNLATGRLRLATAVDEITDELRQTITYLNEMTKPDVEVLALELGYVSDHGIEILVPKV